MGSGWGIAASMAKSGRMGNAPFEKSGSLASRVMLRNVNRRLFDPQPPRPPRAPPRLPWPPSRRSGARSPGPAARGRGLPRTDRPAGPVRGWSACRKCRASRAQSCSAHRDVHGKRTPRKEARMDDKRPMRCGRPRSTTTSIPAREARDPRDQAARQRPRPGPRLFPRRGRGLPRDRADPPTRPATPRAATWSPSSPTAPRCWGSAISARWRPSR